MKGAKKKQIKTKQTTNKKPNTKKESKTLFEKKRKKE